MKKVEIKKIIDAFAFDDTIEKTESFITKWWLCETELFDKWLLLLKEFVLDPENFWKSLELKKEICQIKSVSGLTLYKDEFEIYKRIMAAAGDKEFAIIEEYFDLNSPPHSSGPPIRLKFPSDISWKELVVNEPLDMHDLEGVSYEIFQRPIKNYFIIGDSGKWMKYVGNDLEDSIEIHTYKSEFKKPFETIFSKYDGLEE